MPKSKRLMELMLVVNRKRRFTVKELADEFDVSPRTILRDLKELEELGVPLYSEVGPHGGYRVLNERMLPPIAFTEDEAVAVFFASHALRHYLYMPFETEISSALNKFYSYMPGDVRETIDQMKHRVDFLVPTRQQEPVFLPRLLEAAVLQKVIRIAYDSLEGKNLRYIQPVGIYASGGLWYCPAYCFTRSDYRLFRCDRILQVSEDPEGPKPLNLVHINLDNWTSENQKGQPFMEIEAKLTREGVRRCESELWPSPQIEVQEGGSGVMTGSVLVHDLAFFTNFFLGLGGEATVLKPPELVDSIKCRLEEMIKVYV